MLENQISREIIGCAIEVQKTLGGPGLLESVYEEALCHELHLKNIPFERQKHIKVTYKGLPIGNPLILDLLINDTVIVENKAVSENNPLFESQLLTYLRISNIKLGLLINFGITPLKNGIKRVVNNL